MDIQTEIRQIEGRLKSTGVSVDDFCQRAGINRATWQRWKGGSGKPMLASWLAVLDALDMDTAQ